MEIGQTALPPSNVPRAAVKPAADDTVRPLFVAYMSQMLKFAGTEEVFSGSDSAPGFGFLATEAIAESLARPESALYRQWLARFGGTPG